MQKQNDFITFQGLMVFPDDIPTLTEELKQSLANELINKFRNGTHPIQELWVIAKQYCLEAYIDFENLDKYKNDN